MALPLPDFVARRKPEWDALGALLDSQRHGGLKLVDVQRLDRLYRRASADLAHAQSFYPGTDVVTFLHQLCARAFGSIYRPPRERWPAFKAFFAREFPQAVRAQAPRLALSAGLLFAGAVLGALVVAFDPHGAELLVPENIRQSVAHGQMWTDDILSVMPPNSVASRIATNNLSVTIAVFALGLTAGLGTLWVLINNGLQLGAVAMLCVRAHMGRNLLYFIAAHGFVELSVIVIAGAAGLQLASALVEPGERTRRDALREEGRGAVRLVLGCAPFLAAIGIVEGFVSPGSRFQGPVKLALGIALGSLFWAYLARAGTVSSSSTLTVGPAASRSALRRSR